MCVPTCVSSSVMDINETILGYHPPVPLTYTCIYVIILRAMAGRDLMQVAARPKGLPNGLYIHRPHDINHI